MDEESLLRYVSGKLESLRADELLRTLEPTERGRRASASRRGRHLVSFACNDYLGLSQHPDVIEASCAATRAFGAGAGASRHVTGDHPLYCELEQKLATLKRTEDAIVFGSGYLTNLGVIPALMGREDLIVLDQLSHSCLHAGARLAGSRVLTFAHNDVAEAESLLAAFRTDYRHCLVLTEGVFSMDGDRAPISELLATARRYDAWLMTDDAHGLGVIGGGRGSAVIAGNAISVPLQMGTLSKAVGTYGGYVCTSRPVADFLRNRARSLIYTTGLPPGVVAAASRALDIIAGDEALVARPLAAARRFAERLRLPPPESAIVPIVLGSPARALAASRALEQRGYLVVAIRPPTVPDGTARLRLAFSAVHSDADVDGLADAIEQILATL